MRFFIPFRMTINSKYRRLTILSLYFVIALFFSTSLSAQYAPPAGELGTTAIHADSSIFIDWASECMVERGWVDISASEYGMVTFGNDANGVDKADNAVVSLGDGGIAILNFVVPISDGPGWDFAVFENSFSDDFLELAFVEVSSNGIDYHRFDAISLTQENTQIETFGLIEARQIYNLAGKYRGMFGVPFDLSELANITNLDLSNIVSLRIIDVIGNIDTNYASYDSEGRIINDPWPTPFESGGFDFDAVGVINNQDNTSVSEFARNADGIIFPNPANKYFSISVPESIIEVLVADLNGKLFLELVNPHNNIDIQSLPDGYYIVKVITEDKIYTAKLIKT